MDSCTYICFFFYFLADQNKNQTSMMSGYVRRALSCRHLFWLRSSALHVSDVSPIKVCMSDNSRVFTLPATPNFIVESRRAFAKGRKSSMSLHLCWQIIFLALVSYILWFFYSFFKVSYFECLKLNCRNNLICSVNGFGGITVCFRGF